MTSVQRIKCNCGWYGQSEDKETLKLMNKEHLVLERHQRFLQVQRKDPTSSFMVEVFG